MLIGMSQSQRADIVMELGAEGDSQGWREGYGTLSY